jgi:hypothetical protein
MPTVNPRINVTLSPSLDSLVSRLAALERVSKSMVLRELLETAEPSLSQAVALMEAAKGASVKARQNLATDLQSSIKAAEGTSALVLQNLAYAQRDLVDEAQAIKGRRPQRVQAVRPTAAPPAKAARSAQAAGTRGSRATPPLIGVVSTQNTVKKPSKSASKGGRNHG